MVPSWTAGKTPRSCTSAKRRQEPPDRRRKVVFPADSLQGPVFQAGPGRRQRWRSRRIPPRITSALADVAQWAVVEPIARAVSALREAVMPDTWQLEFSRSQFGVALLGRRRFAGGRRRRSSRSGTAEASPCRSAGTARGRRPAPAWPTAELVAEVGGADRFGELAPLGIGGADVESLLLQAPLRNAGAVARN